MISNKYQVAFQREPELKKLKLLRGIFIFLIIASIIMPQYFGVHIKYDITCSRGANLAILFYMIVSPIILTHFWKTIIKTEVFLPLMVYMFVAIYTMVYRVDVKAFFLVFFELLTFFMLIYAVRYIVGYKLALKCVVGCAYFLSVYGFIEYIYGKSIFLQFFATMPTRVGNAYRSGHYRIMGPCGHSLGYGLLLLIFIAVICYDYNKDELYLFRRPVLLFMLLGNAFLTGSRSTLGIALLECGLIVLFSKGRRLKKTLLYVIICAVVGGILLFLGQGTDIGRYFLGQIFSVVDQFFGTSIAVRFGVDITTMQNSTQYREALPYIFTLDWLNPIMGRGSKFGGAYVHGTYVQSVDNYYVVQYIKYAYPGLISYILFILTSLVVLIREIVKNHSGLAKMVLIGAGCYFFNLWWVDNLQTLKFVYLLLAIFFAAVLGVKDIERDKV